MVEQNVKSRVVYGLRTLSTTWFLVELSIRISAQLPEGLIRRQPDLSDSD